MHGIILVDDRNSRIRILLLYLYIKHLNDRYKLRNNLLKIPHRPLLECLCKNRVIGICAHSGYNTDCIVHLDTTVDQKTDQLRDHHCRMGIIDLNNRIIRQIIQVASLCHCLIQNQLCRIADHEILLINTKHLSLHIAVIRIQKQRQILCNLLFVEPDAVILHNGIIHAVQIKQLQSIDLIIIAGYVNFIHLRLYRLVIKNNRITDIRSAKPALILNPWIRCLLLHVLLKHLLK